MLLSFSLCLCSLWLELPGSSSRGARGLSSASIHCASGCAKATIIYRGSSASLCFARAYQSLAHYRDSYCLDLIIQLNDQHSQVISLSMKDCN